MVEYGLAQFDKGSGSPEGGRGRSDSPDKLLGDADFTD